MTRRCSVLQNKFLYLEKLNFENDYAVRKAFKLSR